MVIEERRGDQGWGLIVAGLGATALGIALAIAVVQLSSALAWAISVVSTSLGIGGGIALTCRGIAYIVEARGRAQAMIEAARAGLLPEPRKEAGDG